MKQLTIITFSLFATTFMLMVSWNMLIADNPIDGAVVATLGAVNVVLTLRKD